MIPGWISASALLGRGGQRPGLDLYEPGAKCLTRLVELEPGQSVYTVARCPNTDSLALGTRFGWTLRIERRASQDGDGWMCVDRHAHGAAVLAVAFVDETLLAESAAGGQCWLWARGESTPVQRLATEHRVVCALFADPQVGLFGLSTAGELLLWDVASGNLMQAVPGAALPSRRALVRLRHWPAASALVWPSPSGGLNVYQLATNRLQQVAAHQGEFYAATALGDELITIGAVDGRLNRWRPDGLEPVESLPGPRSVISACGWRGSEDRLILVDARGSAGVYALAGGQLRQVDTLTGTDFRTVAGPLRSADAPGRPEPQALVPQAAVAAELSSTPASTPSEAHDDPVADTQAPMPDLARQLSECHRLGDLKGQLQAARQYTALLSGAEPWACDGLVWYGDLLRAAWQLEPARAAYLQAFVVDPNHRAAQCLRDIAPYIEAIQGTYVIEAESGVAELLELAAVVGRPLTGRFVIQPARIERLRSVAISAEALAREYERVARQEPDDGTPRPRYERVRWLSRERVEHVELFSIRPQPTEQLKGLQYACRVIPGAEGAMVVPVSLFDTTAAEADVHDGSSDHGALAAWYRVAGTEPATLWLAHVHRRVRRVLQRLESIADHRRLWPRDADTGDGAHEVDER